MDMPNYPEPEEYVGRVGVDHDMRDGALLLSIFKDRSDMRDGGKVVFRIPPGDVADLLRDVANIGANVMSDTIREIVMGDCETCGNRRLVEQVKNGRPMTVNCPGCADRRDIDPFATRPTMRFPDKETPT